jgi:3-oxoacyl-[acyl-carrier protein] reductase
MTLDSTVYGPGKASFDFRDRVVIVTGASGGIGSAIVEMFAEAGAAVVLHGRNADALTEGAERARAAGVKAVTVEGNIRAADTAAALADAALSNFGRIDVLVNNAGGNFGAALTDLSVNGWTATIEANLNGAFYCARACWPTFESQGGGVVVNIGSSSASYAHPLRGAYAAAKAGLASLTRTMAWEWAAQNIRVNCIEPGAVRTKASRFADSEVEERIAAHVALGRVGEPRDIAGACLYLSSDAAGYITGETLVVAGGPHTSTPADVALINRPSSNRG